MPLDMTGDHRHNRAVHYRRYLSNRPGQRIVVVCVQDFDYHDYDPDRFVDLQSFTSKDEARQTPLQSSDVMQQMDQLDEDDEQGKRQALRIMEALDQHMPYDQL